MKKIIYLLIIAAAISCHQKETPVAVKESESLLDPKNPLNKLKYANKIDFYCKMDITKYGVSDTAVYKGKLYGFCAKMCKDEFKKNPEMYLQKNQN
ncbi:YHS domain-containing protein [Flavobacterium sp. CYK-55]|uniref:YHS domain-containing protein n=1 Tax=Flavobacterium sp. CYK-55 TaxID=2835529 RepID=UPI001BCCA309|nr:YHS domain-containing protein [Flavobacterium sp. CYK-55]MBS7786195.1 YHS domain-containing protein [Flavobacterium sp. CYK-55]